jgi:phenylalanyl-tRNA synthetase beta chain
MKIAYSHLVQHIAENPGIDQISDRLFQLGHEHEIDGNILDMEFTPNRGDCLSINGLLRDLAVFYTIHFNQEIYTKRLDKFLIDFENLSENICSQISFLKIEIDEVPETYKEFLEDYFLDLGINKNNFFTDVSNYLSYETGQPTHCYDANKINGKIVFHEIESDKDFETLLDKKITLTKKNAVFSLNDEVINLAGIVGGKSTSCSENTKTVIVECAFFQPEAIIGKSVKYGIQSEASHKFERGVDPKCHDKVLRRFINIVREHANIKDMSIVSYQSKDNSIHKIPVDVKKINKIIGININENDYLNYLLRLGFDFENGFINVPSFRSDVKSQNDLAEEIARVIGYDHIPTSEISIPKNKMVNHKDLENKLRYFLSDHGFYEVVNFPFIGLSTEDAIKVDNPLDSNRKYLRTNVTDSLVTNLLFNERRQKDSIKLFEISDVYSHNNGINKKRKLAIIATGRVGQNYEDFTKTINKKYLTKLFQELLPNKVFNFKILPRDLLDTKIKNEIVTLEVDIEEFSTDILSYMEISQPTKDFVQFDPISDFPSSIRDISFSIKDFSKYKLLEELILEYQHQLLKEVFIFDYYNNEENHEIKIGFRFIFQSKNHTITDTEVNDVMNIIIKNATSINKVSIPGLT